MIHKSHSKNDLIDLINYLGLPIVFSHQDNKKNIQDKIKLSMKEDFKIKDNYFKIETKDQLIVYLEKQNPKKLLTTKEKNDVMNIAKFIINYCKAGYDINCSKYNDIKEIIDDMDYIKQFGDIPSVRRCCKLLKNDMKLTGITFKPYISPQVQKNLDDKKITKSVQYTNIKIRHATPEDPIIVYFN
ncbi:MAG: hypothetical protein ACXAAH_08155 [Promethearchaeota archaeon]|jgi:hypothetical protein